MKIDKHVILSLFITIFFSIAFISFSNAQQASEVKIWEADMTLPTYKVLPADKNPMFYVPANYQGAKRVIYPYAQNDGITSEKTDKTYKAVYLENEFIKICVVPEFGGKLFYGTDKTNNYNFLYKQNVVKSSNVGMTGAWISGGIEWCVFHHHRASTSLMVDYKMVENSDGSKTVWIGEMEPRQRMKWSIGISLFPGKSYVDVQVKMFNRTEQSNSILFWANVATHANDHYQTIFPPSVEYAVYHAKNSFAHWPIATEAYEGNEYYKNNIDLSWWKNHPEPNSFFAFDLSEGFIGGYDYEKNSGTISVGNPNIVAGVKLWEWGPGKVGQAWDKALTDNDGPYAELMVGAYSDNQPDYSWIKQYEVKTANIKWYPMRDLRGLKNANENAAMNLELTPDKKKAMLGFNVTQKYEAAKAILKVRDKIVFEKLLDINPAKPFYTEVAVPSNTKETELEAWLLDAKGNRLVWYKPLAKKENTKLPEPVAPPLAPEEIRSNEACYLAGLRIQQFHNSSIGPNQYFLEVLKRDSLDSRCNVMMGLYKKHCGLYNEAGYYFRNAIKRVTKDYTRPRDCEALYNLGLVLKAQGKLNDAYDTLYRATWDNAFQGPAYFNLAEISCIKKDYATALEHINNSLLTNTQNTIGLNLQCAILRKLNLYNEAIVVANKVLEIDPLDFVAGNELYLSKKAFNQIAASNKEHTDLVTILRNHHQNYLDAAIDYINFGMNDEALELLELAVHSTNENLSSYPEINYCLAYLYQLKGDTDNAEKYFQSASKAATDYCFPFRLEMVKVFNAAIHFNPQDAKAYYYMGNLLYDLQPENAIQQWGQAIEIENTFAIAYRNLGFGYYRCLNKIPAAIGFYETAIKNNKTDPTYFMELDKLYELNNSAPSTRLATMQSNLPLLDKANDLYAQYLQVLLVNGKIELALQNLSAYQFSTKEGNDFVHEINVNAHLLLGNKFLKDGKKKEALKEYLAAAEYPTNQKIGKTGDYERDAEVNYYIGLGYGATGNTKKATGYYLLSSNQKTGENEFLYFKGLSQQQLGNKKEADNLFNKLIIAGEEKLKNANRRDFFAKFGEADQQTKNKVEGHFYLALGYLGKGENDKAKEALNKTLELKIDHLWAREFLNQHFN